MEDTDREALIDLLRRRLRVIADQELRNRDPEAHLRELQEVSEALEEARLRLRPGLDPRLAHFLERCSYQKALEMLEGTAGK